MKKICLLFLIFSAFALSGLSAGLRDSVMIIEPVLNSEIKATYEKIASYYEGRGLGEAAEYFRSWAKGGHGSGFAVKIEGGPAVIVTNRHVAAYANTVNIIVDNGVDEKREYKDCKVLYIDYLVDIALIAIPEGLSVPVLDLGTAEITDGADVWSAGYPGFMNKPSWQLTKGTVTNRNVLVDDVAPAGENNFLQHSASIDPGNSGGPLLIGDVTKPASLRVVGINTLTATQRNNTFFAVPTSKLKAVFTRYAQEQKNALDTAKSLALASADLEKFINAESWDRFAYLLLFSNSTASESTWLELQKTARSMSTKDRDDWLGSFYYRPVDTLRKFASYSVWNQTKKFEAKLVIDPLTAVKKDQQFELSANQGTVTWRIIMVQDGGRWMVKSFDNTGDSKGPGQPEEKPKAEVQGQSGIGGITPSGGAFLIGPSMAMPGSAGSQPGFSLAGLNSMSLGQGFTVDLSIQVLLNHYKNSDWYPYMSSYSSSSSLNSDAKMYPSLNYGLGLSYFLMIYDENGYFAPFVGGRFIFGNNFSLMDGFGPTSDIGSSFGKIFDVGLAPRIGIEFSFDRRTAFGIEGSMNWYMVGFEGIRSFPVMLYIKQVTIN